MRTLQLTIAYDGTDYVGWQRQANGMSVQQIVEEALAPFDAAAGPPAVHGAGRTDAGVHATGQVASVVVDFDHPADAVQRALNIRLPGAIRVYAVAEAPAGFHARFDARGKTYRYRIATAPVVPPMDRWFVWHVPHPLDLAAMREAASLLVGTHDFAAFQAAGATVRDTCRTVRRLALVERPGELHLEIEGDGFLRHMVRIVTGSLVDIGMGTRRPPSIAHAIASGDRRQAGRTAPPAGLVLERVDYDASGPSHGLRE